MMAAFPSHCNRYFSQVFLKSANTRWCFSYLQRLSNYHNHDGCALWITPQKRLVFTTFQNHSEKKFEKPGEKITKVVTEDGILEKKTKTYVTKITLFTLDNEMQVISLDDANKLAKRRNLKLVKTADMDKNSGRALYKLMTAAEHVTKNPTDKEKKANAGKSDKLININSRIAEHDLQSKINNILKWLAKEHSVRIVITGSSDNLSSAEHVFNNIAEGVNSSGRILQKLCKNGEIKFQVMPPKKPKASKTEPIKTEETFE